MHPYLGIQIATLLSESPFCVLDFWFCIVFRFVLRLFVFCLGSCQLTQNRRQRGVVLFCTHSARKKIPARIGAQRDFDSWFLISDQGPHVDNTPSPFQDLKETGVKRSACGCSGCKNCPRINFKYYFGRSDPLIINEICIALFASLSTNRFRFSCVIFWLLIIKKITKKSGNCVCIFFSFFINIWKSLFLCWPYWNVPKILICISRRRNSNTF